MSFARALAEGGTDGEARRRHPRTQIITIDHSISPSALTDLLASAVDRGVHILIKIGKDPNPVAALLPRQEYELLNAAAEIAGDPVRYDAIRHYRTPENTLSLEDVFPE